MLDKSLFEQYALYKTKIDELEKLAEELKPKILGMLQEAGKPVEISGTGKFSVASRKTWEYSMVIQSEEVKLKEKKKYEEQSGKASYKETFYPKFSAES